MRLKRIGGRHLDRENSHSDGLGHVPSPSSSSDAASGKNLFSPGSEPTSRASGNARPIKTLDDLIGQNIETIARIEEATLAGRPRSAVFADVISKFCGSMAFVWIHLAWFVGWLLINATDLLPRAYRFDPPPFGGLTLIVSLEAIFLSTFILISQNHQETLANNRNHLDLQINMLAEQENSQVLRMLKDIVTHLGIESDTERAGALSRSTDPTTIVERIDQTGPKSAP